jgi:hypothetical protein
VLLGASTAITLLQKDYGTHYALIAGVDGEVYNIGCDNELTNLDIAKKLVLAMRPELSVAQAGDYIVHTEDRAFNDVRYDIDSQKLQAHTRCIPTHCLSVMFTAVRTYTSCSTPAFMSFIRLYSSTRLTRLYFLAGPWVGVRDELRGGTVAHRRMVQGGVAGMVVHRY